MPQAPELATSSSSHTENRQQVAGISAEAAAGVDTNSFSLMAAMDLAPEERQTAWQIDTAGNRRRSMFDDPEAEGQQDEPSYEDFEQPPE